MSTQLYLKFPDRDTALIVGAILIGEEFIENFHADGWWTNPETGETVYWNLDEIGLLPASYDEDGNEIAPAPEGYHINGWWHSDSPVPELLATYQIFPETPARVWG